MSVAVNTAVGRFSQLDTQSQLKLKVACDYINAEVSKVRRRIVTAGIVGIVLGLIVGWSRTIYRGLYPVMIGFNSVPKVAVVPILIMWFGIGEIPAILTAFLISFFPIVVNVATGLATMSQQIGITMGTPVMSAIATGAMTTATVTGILHGIRTAVAVNTALVLATALIAALFLRTPTTQD